MRSPETKSLSAENTDNEQGEGAPPHLSEWDKEHLFFHGVADADGVRIAEHLEKCPVCQQANQKYRMEELKKYGVEDED
jgi:hypothetical protein